MNASQSPIITIRRPAQFGAGDQIFRVFVDGREAGALGPGETIRIPVTPGRHTLRLRTGWCCSRRLTVVAGQASPTFDCGSNAHCDCFTEAVVKSRDFIWIKATAAPGGETHDGTTA